MVAGRIREEHDYSTAVEREGELNYSTTVEREERAKRLDGLTQSKEQNSRTGHEKLAKRIRESRVRRTHQNRKRETGGGWWTANDSGETCSRRQRRTAVKGLVGTNGEEETRRLLRNKIEIERKDCFKEL